MYTILQVCARACDPADGTTTHDDNTHTHTHSPLFFSRTFRESSEKLMVSWADVMPLLGQLHTRNTEDDAHGEAPAAAADEDEEAEEAEEEEEEAEEEEEEEASAGFPSTMVFIEVVSVRVLKTAEKQSRAPWMPSKVSLWGWGRCIDAGVFAMVCVGEMQWCVLEGC